MESRINLPEYQSKGHAVFSYFKLSFPRWLPKRDSRSWMLLALPGPKGRDWHSYMCQYPRVNLVLPLSVLTLCHSSKVSSFPGVAGVCLFLFFHFSLTLWKMALPSAAVKSPWSWEYASVNIQMCSWTAAPSERPVLNTKHLGRNI